MIQAGKFAPGVGAHYVALRATGDINADGTINPSSPGSLIFDGNSPTSRLVGLMYISPTEPEGFAGPNDHWHRHTNTCVQVRPRGYRGALRRRLRRHPGHVRRRGRQLHGAHHLDGACVGRPRLGEPTRCVLARQPEPALRRRYRRDRQSRFLRGDLTDIGNPRPESSPRARARDLGQTAEQHEEEWSWIATNGSTSSSRTFRCSPGSRRRSSG